MNIANPAANSNSSLGLNPFALRRWWLKIDQDKRALSWSQTYVGQAILHVVFIALMFAVPVLTQTYNMLTIVALALCAVVPKHRLLALSALASLYFILRPFKTEIGYTHTTELLQQFGLGSDLFSAQFGISASGVLLVLIVVGMGELQRKNINAFPVQRPILSMFLLSVLLTFVSWQLPQAGLFASISWIILALISSTFFLLAYIFLDNRGKAGVPISQRIGFVRPIWTMGLIPTKGPNFIKKHEAKDDVALATTRLKAIKLALWAAILFWLWELVFNRFLFGHLGFPRLEETITLVAQGQAFSVAENWSILVAYFMAELLEFAFHAHIFVAIIRMLGFQIPRGLFSPLASRSISEFWGRYLFYFKEMLADIFFFPTFQRFFKKSPKLRIAFATFIAAFFGNILFDLIPQLPGVAVNGAVETLDNFYSYIVYAALLTIGLIVSQLWSSRPKPEDGQLRYNILPRVRVIGFFIILQIFDDSTGIVPLGDRVEFFFSLFGVR